MKKRIIATLLAGVMTLAMLAGCGQEEKQTATSQSKATSTEESSKTSEVKEVEPEETKTVTWYIYGTKQDDHDLVMEDLNKKLKEKINVELDLQVIPSGEFNEKMRLLSTSGETYELAWTSSWKNKFDANMTREAFMPIDDLLQEYGQGILENCPGWLLDMGKVNGKQYAIPSLQAMGNGGALYIQKKLAEEYGWDKERIDSFDDAYPFFDWVKEKYPELVPLSFDTGVKRDYLKNYEEINSFLYFEIANPDKIIPVTELDGENLKSARMMLDKGYIREDIATVSSPTGDRNTGRYAAIWATGKPGGDAEASQKWGVEYIMVPLGKGGYIPSTSGQNTMNAFNVNAKEPEAAMKLLNLLWTDEEIFNELLFGVEGVHYNKVGEDRVEVIEGSKYNFGSIAWIFANQFNAWKIHGQSDTVWEETQENLDNATVSPNAGFVVDFTDYQTEIAQLNSVKTEYEIGYYTCKDVDAFLAERNAKYEAAGLQKLVNGVQAQLDAWRKANNK